jgi:RNA polymerase sigma-70 factor (ECF subfamily)
VELCSGWEAEVCPIELMQRYCEGEEAAFRDLYTVVAPKIMAYLATLARAHDRSVAEDLLQQTFLKLHSARSSYVRGANPLPWIYTIAHRAFLDHTRRRRRSPLRFAGRDEEVPEIATDLQGRIADHQPSRSLDEAAHAALLGAMDRLGEAQRLALITTKLEERTMAEAATILGTTEGALKVRAHRAYGTLRSMLTEAVVS